jgi:hypothetical protein
VQHEVNGCQQEVGAVLPGHQRIYGLQGAVGQFQVVGQHDDRNFGPDLLDLVGDSCAVQSSQVVVKHDCVDGLRHKKPQTIGAIGRGYEFISVFLQRTQLIRVSVDAE